jgi:hypothetical protein
MNDRVGVYCRAEVEPSGGTPPMTPGSAVRVKSSLRSFRCDCRDPFRHSDSRFTMAPARSSSAQRLAMIFRWSSIIGLLRAARR